jgi:ADP-ribosyl-[dinitrogen reductase] hydrolase
MFDSVRQCPTRSGAVLQILNLKTNPSIIPNSMAGKATRASWQNIPIDDPKRIDISLRFTDDQFSSLTKGLIPEEMEDKWFIFYEDGWLYFHRSWTGFGIYKAQLIKETDGYSINEFQAERNREKYSCNDDNHDTDDISFLIARGLLGIDVRNIYADKKMKSEPDILKSWSSFGSLLFSNQGINYTDKVKSVLFGVAVGDALGVPVEFTERNILKKNPVTDMTGYGTHHQLPGTFSDDSSLTFCLAEALTEGFNPDVIGRFFVRWHRNNYWTARGTVFDIGNATRQAIDRLAKGVEPDLAEGTEGSSNGNGSLMRILPLLFYLPDKPFSARFEMTKLVSSLTHRHIRSVIACFYYLEFALKLLA